MTEKIKDLLHQFELDGRDGRSRVDRGKHGQRTCDWLLAILILEHGYEGRPDLATPTKERP